MLAAWGASLLVTALPVADVANEACFTMGLLLLKHG